MNEYEKLAEDISKSFIESFKHDLPVTVSETKKYKKWIIKYGKLDYIKSILRNIVLAELEKKELKLLSEESKKKLDEFELKIKDAKEDLDFINKKINEFADLEEVN